MPNVEKNMFVFPMAEFKLYDPVSLATSGGAGTATRFDQLLDVTEGTPANGDIVVYNASNDKYEVKSLGNTSITLDGGSF